MQLGCFFSLAAMAAGFAASYWDYSIWWSLAGVLLAGACLQATYSFDTVMRAQERGSISALPIAWAAHSIGPAILTAVAYGIGAMLK